MQELRDRMSQHRSATKPGKDSGNFRLRQHYACSEGRCTSFRIFIIQKLPGSGRTSILNDNSNTYKIDGTVTKIRKNFEDNWVRKLHTQYPYGCMIALTVYLISRHIIVNLQNLFRVKIRGSDLGVRVLWCL